MSSETPEFRSALDEVFPGATLEENFVRVAQSTLQLAGFSADNSIALVGVCRDEICDHLVSEVGSAFGPVFRIGGLGGLIVCGNTGFGAAHAHSPVVDGRKRYVYIVAPHIAVDEAGQIGTVKREGIDKKSSACGALCAFLGELESGTVNLKLNPADVEMSLLRKALAPHLTAGKKIFSCQNGYQAPDLADLTKLAEKVLAEEQLKARIAATVDTSTADYAVIAGIQVHGPGGKTYFYPVTDHCQTVVKGVKSPLKFQAVDVPSS